MHQIDQVFRLRRRSVPALEDDAFDLLISSGNTEGQQKVQALIDSLPYLQKCCSRTRLNFLVSPFSPE
ncbi:MAG: hypothetical protein R3A47_03540 [Polyangiales bacterium]